VSSEIHIDNDFMQTLLKRIDELELELSTHKRQVDSLQLQVETILKLILFVTRLFERLAAKTVACTIVVYYHNDSGLYYKTMILANLVLTRSVNYDCKVRSKLKRTLTLG